METNKIIQLLAILAKSEGLYVEKTQHDETEKTDRSQLLKGGESELTYSKFNKLEVGASSTTRVGTIDNIALYKKAFEGIHIPTIPGVVGAIASVGGASSLAAGGGNSAIGGGGSPSIAGGGSPAIAGGRSSAVAGGGNIAAAVGETSAAAAGTSGSLWSAVGGFAWNAASSLWRSVAGNYAVTARVQLVPVHDLLLNLGYAHRERLANRIRQIMNEHSVLNINDLADEIQQDSSLVRRIILTHLIDFIVDDMSLNVVVSNKDDSKKS